MIYNQSDPSLFQLNKFVIKFYLAGCTGTWGKTSRCQTSTGSRWGQATGTPSLLQAQQSISYTSLHGHHSCTLINRSTNFKFINNVTYPIMNTDKVLKKRKKKEREEENKKENDINNRALDLALDYFSCKKLKLVSNKVSFLLTYKIHK